MKDYLTFRRMITPIFLQVFFWIAVVVIVIAGLVMLGDDPLAGILVIVLGPLAARIYAEILMVIFRINDSLLDVRNIAQRMSGQAAAPQPPTVGSME